MPSHDKTRRGMIAQPSHLVNVPGVLLNRATVEMIVSLSLVTINRRIKQHEFPARFKDGRWLSNDIRAWIDGTWRPGSP